MICIWRLGKCVPVSSLLHVAKRKRRLFENISCGYESSIQKLIDLILHFSPKYFSYKSLPSVTYS